jgi:hypothetical protein
MSTPIETTAVMDVTPCDLDDLVEKWRAYHAIYSPLFQRREQREWAGKYLHGLLVDLPRAEVPHDTRVWPQRPATVLPPWIRPGSPPDMPPRPGRGTRAHAGRAVGD